MKKGLSILLVIVLLIVLVPINLITFCADSITKQELQSRYNSVKNGTYGVGHYFRNNQSIPCCFSNGSACHGNHSDRVYTDDSYCNCKVATADIAGVTGGIQCFGYARYVFYQLFGQAVATSYSSDRYRLSSTANVTTVGSTDSNSTNTAKEILSRAYLGDFIQTARGSSMHSMIVESVSDSGVTVLECNHDANCYINTRTISFSSFASTYNKFSLYRSTNHPGDINPSPVSAPTYAVLTTDAHSYAVDEIATFTCNTDGNVNVLWIYCPNGEELHYDFDNSNSIQLGFGMMGHYQALVQAWNGVGSLCSERIDFVVGPPTYSILTTDCKSYAVDEIATFTCNTDGNVNVLWIYCPNGDELHYDFDNSDSIKLGFGMLGHYQALVQAWNGVGSLCSEIIDFVVGSPTYATLTTDSQSYAVDETATFTCNTDGNVNVLWIYCPNGERLHYNFDDSGSIQLGFGLAGHYQALVQAWNGVGSLCSEIIDFVVGSPTYAILTTDQSNYSVNQTISFACNTDGNVNVLWVYYPNGESAHYSFDNSSTIELSLKMPGHYQALVQAWNRVGSLCSEKIDFSINAMPGDVDGDGDIGLKDVVQITRYLAGGWDVTVDLAVADVNKDGEVNLKDAVLLRRYLAGGWCVQLV